MKLTKKMLLLSSVIALWTNINTAMADLNSDAEIIFNWAEALFPQYFPQHSETQTIPGWRFRAYPGTGAYAGVNIDDQYVYVLGGPFGGVPLKIESVANLAAAAGGTNTPSADTACDQAKVPAGLQVIQNGNHVKITTNGACVALPKSSICVPPKSTATGISAVSENKVNSFDIQGLKWSHPDLAVAFAPTIQEAINVKTCLINVSQAFVNQTAEMDVCLDVTSDLAGFATQLKGLATIEPPVTMKLQSNIVNKTVADCFSAETNATIVSDAVTDETWIKQNGQFVKIK